jgi:predicted DNA-binding transcriptional regulator YafY
MATGDRRRFAGLQRTLKLVKDLLDGEVHNSHTAAELIGKKQAAAQRQLRAIQDTLPGMIWEPREGGRVLRFDRTRLGTSLDEKSVVASCFAASLSTLFVGTGLGAGMREARDYLVERAPRRKAFKDLDRKFRFVGQGGEYSLPDKGPLLDHIISAVFSSQAVTLQYQHFSGVLKMHRVQPLTLCVYGHQIYCIGRSQELGDYPFRFARILSVSREAGHFTYPGKGNYDPDVLFRDSFGIFISDDFPIAKVAIRLDVRWATYVNSHKWHPSQEVSSEDDGHLIVRLKVRLCPELKSWILGFGKDAEVLSPKKLRDEVAESLRDAAGRYSG